MNLKELIKQNKWLNKVKVNMLECINWEKDLDLQKDELVFKNADKLVDLFIEKVKEETLTIDFLGEKVNFMYADIQNELFSADLMIINDTYNKLEEKIAVDSEKLQILTNMMYYSDPEHLDYYKRKHYRISKEEYKKLKNWIQNPPIVK